MTVTTIPLPVAQETNLARVGVVSLLVAAADQSPPRLKQAMMIAMGVFLHLRVDLTREIHGMMCHRRAPIEMIGNRIAMVDVTWTSQAETGHHHGGHHRVLNHDPSRIRTTAG
jgi:hypothetical protein